MTDLTVIIPSHNEGEWLPWTVANVQRASKLDPTIFVVDDHSEDGSGDSVKDTVTVLRDEKPLGCSAAKNYGLGHAETDYVAFVDAHCDVTDGWDEVLVSALSRNGNGLVGPTVRPVEPARNGEYPPGRGMTFKNAALDLDFMPTPRETEADVLIVPGMCQVFRRADLLEVGGFDEGMGTWGSEDVEISIQLWRRGLSCSVTDRATVFHRFQATFPYAVDFATTVHNRLRVAARHFGDTDLMAVVNHYRKEEYFPEVFLLLMEQATDTMLGPSAEEVMRRFGVSL